MAEERIDSFIDLPAVKKEYDSFAAMLGDLKTAFDKLNGTKITLQKAGDSGKEIVKGMQEAAAATEGYNKTVKAAVDQHGKLIDTAKQLAPTFDQQKKVLNALSGSFEDNVKLQVQYKIRLSEIASELKLLAKETTDAEKATDTYKSKVAELTKEQLIIKAGNQELNTSIRNQVKEMNAAGGSIDQLQARLNQLQNTYESIGEEERASPFGQTIKAAIDELEPKVKGFEASIGKFGRNVGNYGSAFYGAFDVLDKDLSDIRKQLADPALQGAQLKSLQQQEMLLTELTHGLKQEFTSTRAEARAFQEAAAKIGITLGQQSKIFQEFKDQVGEGTDALQDIKDSVKLAASDTSGLDRLIGAANGIAGAFGVAQGVIALTGDESEETQKQIAKFAAILTILNGLQAVQAELKNKDSIASRVAAAGQALYSTAIGASTGALRIFRIALAATGIGLVIAAIGLLVANFDKIKTSIAALLPDLSGFSKSFDKIKQVAAGAFDGIIEGIKTYGTLIKNVFTFDFFGAIDTVQNAGKNVAKAYYQGLKEERARQLVGLVNETTKNEIAALENNIKIAKARGEETSKLEIELEKKKARQIFIEKGTNSKEYLDQVVDLASKELEVQKEFAKKELDIQKEFADKSKKASLDIQKSKLQAQSDALNSTADNDKIPLNRRLQALKDLERVQVAAIQIQRNYDVSHPKIIGSERAAIEKKVAGDIQKIRLESTKKIQSLNDSFLDNERKVQLELLHIRNDAKIRDQNSIAGNDSNNITDRLAAVDKGFELKKQLIEAEARAELQVTGITAMQKQVIEEKSQAAINQILIDSGVKKLDIIKSGFSKEDALRQEALDKKLRQIDTNESGELRALNASFDKNLISLEEYEKKKSAIQGRFELERLAQSVKNAREAVVTAIGSKKDTSKLEADLAKASLELDDYITSKKIANAEKLKEVQKAFLNDVADAFQEFIGFQFDAEKNAIQDQINELEKKKQKDIEVVNSQTASQEKKAADIAIIEARAQAQRGQLELKQKGIDERRAKFEKAIGIIRIAVETSATVSKLIGAAAAARAQASVLLSNPITAAYAGVAFAAAAAISAQIPFVIGSAAAQAALIAARPIPKYKDGIDDHPGGIAIVGDAGKKEVIVTPEGKMYETSSTPTLVSIPQHSSVYPDADKIAGAMQYAAFKSLPRIEPGAGHDKRLLAELNLQYDKQGKLLKAIQSAIANKPVANINNTHTGVMTSFRNANSQWEYINRNMQS